ncbi:alpha-amylase family glycosyl hydrolase [Galbitalea sp. SE-J8]|uniref:alpha-amylase family glycosyl hydrolase n=1 Tax=Galbitalea sp. SE-J8 TaxID=3054952 RepID=UPI00259C7399|nr:alpha-amylase family glycosyl hydrolase [Galbitalea sp. SE-J8]MDM4762041.1 alpha-amylase family glycosyl hydrolase [Galbitalea sp. SE-J8]
MTTPPAWLTDAVIYEIYPQSFSDGDGDGIGDLRGVIERLDYLHWLGVDVIWFNPCFRSPFRDAGYDVSDYLRIAPRYGSNDDMVELIAEARARGIRVLLDLVAGHTSIDHPWFAASAADPADDRYIWADRPGRRLVASPGPRPGWYLKNFFDEQPALNFGYARLDPDEPWREPPDAPGPRANRRALREIIGFWVERGVAGFRVDMAFSLVKDDPDLAATTALWRDLRAWLRTAHPDAVLIPESDEAQTPDAGQRADFDADFALVIHPEHSALFNNGGAGILPWQHAVEPCYFDPDGDVAAGTRALETFLARWDAREALVGPERALVLPSSDHDFSRLACGPRTGDQLRAAFTLLLTWGTIPSVYYGDEIGMRYLTGLPDREGSIWDPRFNRAGCRTPMQWDAGLPNDGFSTADPSRLYLPQDPGADRPTVAAQIDDPGSLLRFVRELVRLRRATAALGPAASRTVLAAGYPFVFLRGDTHLVALNPHRDAVEAPVEGVAGARVRRLAGTGVAIDGDRVRVDGFGHGVFALERAD